MTVTFRNLICGLGAILLVGGATITAQAATVVNFSWAGNGGYSAKGSFAFDAATTPTSFSEAGSGAKKYLQSFNISFFNPQNVLLETGSSVVNGISSDSFFRMDFNTQTNTFSALDADVGGSNYQYFLTNLRTPGGQVVAPGITTYNLFVRTTGTPNLDVASTVSVTSVSQTPEPGTFGLLASIGCLGLGGVVLRRRVFQKS